MRTAKEAKARLAKCGAMTLVRVEPPEGREAPPALVEEIAGEPVKGSWWSHPKGKVIFAIATALDEADDVVSAKLARGKVTFVHEKLWSALLRVVTDAGFRKARIAALTADGRKLLVRVEKEGRVRAEGVTKPKVELEAAALVRATQEHTESGRHATILESWPAWAPASAIAAAAGLSFEGAIDTLARAGISLEPPRGRAKRTPMR